MGMSGEALLCELRRALRPTPGTRWSAARTEKLACLRRCTRSQAPSVGVRPEFDKRSIRSATALADLVRGRLEQGQEAFEVRLVVPCANRCAQQRRAGEVAHHDAAGGQPLARRLWLRVLPRDQSALTPGSHATTRV